MIRTVGGWIAGLLALHGVVAGVYVATVGVDHRTVELDRAFFASDDEVTVLVAGGSHARNAIAAESLGGMSIAVAGELPLKTRFRLPWLLDRSERPIGAVVLELDSVSVSGWKADVFDPEYVWGRYVPFIELGMLRGAPLDYAGKWGKAWLVPYAGEWNNLMFWGAGLRAFQDEAGLDRFKGQPPAWMRKSGEVVAKAHFEGHHPADPAMIWGFHELVRELRARQVRVVVVRFPVQASYREAAASYGATPDILDEVLAPVLEPGVVDALDFSDLYDGRPDAFYDGDHIGGKARRHFTRVLADELEALGIATR